MFSEPFVSGTVPGYAVYTRTKAHLNNSDLICATCGFSAGLFDNLCVRLISLHDKYTVCSSLKCTTAVCLSVRDTQALIDRPSESSPLGAPSRTKPGALKNSLSPAYWRNMAPIRPERTAKLYPLNTRLPPPRSITVKYDSLEVDTVIVAPASLRSCNAGHGSCFTLQQRTLAPGLL